MHGPAVVTWLLTALALASGGYGLSRLRAHRTGAAEAAMGLGMAGMALLPGPLWGWLFALLGGALTLRAVDGRSGDLLHHGVGALAMAYMSLAMAVAPTHAHQGGTVGVPLVTGVLLLYFGCYTVWTGSRVLILPTDGAAGMLARACRAAMGIGMFAMLLTL